MENLARLLELYRDDKRTQSILALLQNATPSRLQIAGLRGAQESFVLSGLYLAKPGNFLIIADEHVTDPLPNKQTW